MHGESRGWEGLDQKVKLYPANVAIFMTQTQPHPGGQTCSLPSKLEEWRWLDMEKEVLHIAASLYRQKIDLLNNTCFNAQKRYPSMTCWRQYFMRKWHHIPTNQCLSVSLHYINKVFWHCIFYHKSVTALAFSLIWLWM